MFAGDLDESDEIIRIGCADQDPDHTAVKQIRKKPREPVYNMEVDTYHNFAINGGLIVHNSIDATRYALERVYRHKGK